MNVDKQQGSGPRCYRCGNYGHISHYCQEERVPAPRYQVRNVDINMGDLLSEKEKLKNEIANLRDQLNAANWGASTSVLPPAKPTDWSNCPKDFPEGAVWKL
jgi:hypothetical protein